MAEDSAPTNGHRPTRRPRKRIYPPPEQMAAQRAAAGERPKPAKRAAPVATIEPDFGPEADAPPAPPVMAALEPTSGSAALATVDEDDGAFDGENVELRLSAVGMVDAGDVSFSQGALGAVRADNVTVEKGAVGATLANNVEVSRGYARSIVARQVQLDRAVARIVVAADVKAERSAVMFLVARRVAGDVRVLLDWRGAVAFGAVAGLIMGLLRRRPPRA
jgi:hypothetical protein